jgi:hypothetical protein
VTTTQTDQTTPTTVKSGRGTRHGAVSEMAAFFDVIPGREEALREACARFGEALRGTDPVATRKTGLRDSRQVIFDGGRKLIWATTFETDWDPYLDDAVLLMGVDHFIDWMQHTEQAGELAGWMNDAGGRDTLRQATTDASMEATVRASTAGLKRILQSVQQPAASYFNALSDYTLPEVEKAGRVERAFQRVLDDPAAEQALTQPALAPLLAEAAD